jgi:soluble lytic murein transglycosylase
VKFVLIWSVFFGFSLLSTAEELKSMSDVRFAEEIKAAANRHGLDPHLVRAVIFYESGFDPFARGNSGEIGLMQILPSGAVADWARIKSQDIPSVHTLFDPDVNLEIGCWYLAYGIKKYAAYRQAIELALARYNAGENRSEKWKPMHNNGDVLERIEIIGTRNYVEKVMERYKKYKGIL